MRWLTLLLMVLLTFCSLTGCIWNWGNDIKDAELTTLEESKLSVTYNEEEKYYDVYVEGIIKNLEEFDAYASMTIVLYDKEGNAIASVYDSLDGIEAGGTWRYCIHTTTIIEPCSSRLKDLYGCEAY